MADDPMLFQEQLVIPSANRGPVRFKEAMANFQRERFEVINPALLAVAKGDRPAIGRYWWEATKGASKDSDLAVCLMWLIAFTRRPLLCQVGAADQDQADELRKAAKDILHLNPWLGDFIVIKNWCISCAKNRAVIEIVAADVAGSHGGRPDVLVLNELSHVTKKEFAENLMDNAAKVPRGLVVIATNAGFENTWQHAWRKDAQNNPRWHFSKRSEPSPWLDPEQIEDARRRNSPSRFMRLWYGVWSKGLGDLITGEDLLGCTVHLEGLERWDPTYPVYLGGLDCSLTRHHTSFVVVAIDERTGKVRVVHIRNWKPGDFADSKIHYGSVARYIAEARERYRIWQVNFDPAQSGDSVAEQIVELAGKSVPGIDPLRVKRVTGAKANTEMATAVIDAFKNRRIELWRDELLHNDLSKLSIQEKPTGYKIVAPEDPETGHADRAMALAVILPTALEFATELHAKYAAMELQRGNKGDGKAGGSGLWV